MLWKTLICKRRSPCLFHRRSLRLAGMHVLLK